MHAEHTFSLEALIHLSVSHSEEFRSAWLSDLAQTFGKACNAYLQ